MPRMKTKKKIGKPRRNAADSTLRNVQAANKKLVEHAHWIGELRAKLDDLETRVNGLEPPLIPAEPPTGPDLRPGEPWR